MVNSGFYTSHLKLEEGKQYSFKYLKDVTLADTETYMVFEDINGIRHFVSKNPYIPYNFSKGDTVTCTVDKINCTGRLFIEPLHPYYQSEKVYTFEVIEVISSSKQFIINVIDYFQNVIPIELSKAIDVSPGQIVRARILKIKKGKPELLFVS